MIRSDDVPRILSRNRPASQAGDWKASLRRAIRDPVELLRALELSPELLPAARDGAALFPLLVPRGFAARMRPGDPHDPLLRQVLPLAAESATDTGFLEDPVGDCASLRGTGVLHKYHGRVLLITTGACAVNCRYCFRRHFPYSGETAGRSGWRDALDYITADHSIAEVILSGGDPLMLDTPKLEGLTRRLAEIPHVRRLRIHTRMPVVLPERVDEPLADWLRDLPFQKVLVIHANHPAELGGEVYGALQRLKATGVTLLNQAVLLNGVNDDAVTLESLGERLFAGNVLPYYLHLLDRVRGAAHFEVAEPRARSVYRALRARVPGYLLPRLVREIPGEPSKTPVL